MLETHESKINVNNIAIHIESKHTCGRMQKMIFHVKDSMLEGHVNTQYSPFEPVRSGEFAPHVEPETENKLELTGSLGGVEFTTCICRLSRRARMRQWLSRILARYRHKEQGQ
jgi:hypothetical protein